MKDRNENHIIDIRFKYCLNCGSEARFRHHSVNKPWFFNLNEDTHDGFILNENTIETYPVVTTFDGDTIVIFGRNEGDAIDKDKMKSFIDFINEHFNVKDIKSYNIGTTLCEALS